MSRISLRCLAASLVLALAGCTADDPAPPAPPACQPDLATYESEVRPRIERYCGTCHGETQEFGAPFSLLQHAPLVAVGEDGRRIVDLIGDRLFAGEMPPVGMPRIPEEDADIIAAWATCGEVDVPPMAGLVASAPPLLAPEEPPAGLETLDFAADEYAVAPDALNDYRCFVFDADVTADRFVRRFEMIFDETSVLHHVVLLRDTDRESAPGNYDCYGGGGMPPGSQYLYAWAPGQSALEFPEGGLRVSPGERFIVQIHYNNAAARTGLRDSSGVRLYLGPPSGPEYGMIAIGPTDFSLPPRERTSVSSRCTTPADTTVFAGMPHMHRRGAEFTQTIRRASGAREPLISLTGWSFETQLFYSTPTLLGPGDVIETTCVFENESASPVFSGEDTEDEMCFNFLYATPPPPSRYCDEGTGDRPTDVAYAPGACLPAGTTGETPLVRGMWNVAAAPPALTQGPVPDGRWVLESLDYTVTGVGTPIGNIDVGETYVLGRGQVITGGGALVYDVAQDTVVLSEGGTRFGEPQQDTFSVPFDATTSPVTAAATCPAGDRPSFDWGIEGDVLTIGFTARAVPGQTLWPRFHFRRQMP
jgi:hypothetical protein